MHWVLLAVLAIPGCGRPGAFPVRAASGILSPADATGRRPAPVTTPREEVLRWAQGTYIHRVLAERDSVLDRWNASVDEPIRVWIDDPPRGYPDHAPVVAGAFRDWTAIGLPVRFVFVDRRDAAQVRVTWHDSPNRRTGNTVWRVDNDGWMRGSDVVLAARFADGRPLDPMSVRAIALHEVGHVLGLSHSTDAHDIMAPIVRATALSPSDRATARLLYTLPAGRVR